MSWCKSMSQPSKEAKVEWNSSGFLQNLRKNKITLYMTFPWLSMTKLAIFHDYFCGQDSGNFSRDIHYWTILETTISLTILWRHLRVVFLLFHDNFGNWYILKVLNLDKMLTLPWLLIFLFSMTFLQNSPFRCWWGVKHITPWLSMTANFSMTILDFPWLGIPLRPCEMFVSQDNQQCCVFTKLDCIPCSD